MLIDYLNIILAFKLKYGLLKHNNLISLVKDIHNRSTRNREDFYVFNCETKYGASNFLYRGLIKFNNLDEKVKKFRTLSIFANRLRETLFDEYIVLARGATR